MKSLRSRKAPKLWNSTIFLNLNSKILNTNRPTQPRYSLNLAEAQELVNWKRTSSEFPVAMDLWSSWAWQSLCWLSHCSSSTLESGPNILCTVSERSEQLNLCGSNSIVVFCAPKRMSFLQMEWRSLIMQLQRDWIWIEIQYQIMYPFRVFANH